MYPIIRNGIFSQLHLTIGCRETWIYTTELQAIHSFKGKVDAKKY